MVKQIKRVLPLVPMILLYTGVAFAATSGTALDQTFTQVERFVSGPIAGFIGLAGFVGAGFVWITGHTGWAAAMGTFFAAVIVAVIISNFVSIGGFFFPLAGAFIR